VSVWMLPPALRTWTWAIVRRSAVGCRGMFERVAAALAEDIEPLAQGRLSCLSYSRACLDALSSLGQRAKPLVVRGVVLGRSDIAGLYEDQDAREQLANAALAAHQANGRLVLGSAGAEAPALQIPYRTIGMPHPGEPGDQTLGNFDETGKWLGHLVVVADGTLIDMTIGQFNSSRLGIELSPPYLTSATNRDFLAGAQKLYAVRNGHLICYRAYPAERTHEASRSWTDPTERANLQRIGRQTASRFVGQPNSRLHDPA